MMERWKQYFYETYDVELREEVMFKGPEEQIEPPNKWWGVGSIKNIKE